MELELIKSLIQSFNEAELTNLTLKCKEFELQLGKEKGDASIKQEEVPTKQAVIENAQQTVQRSVIETTQPPVQMTTIVQTEEQSEKYILSPMVGTFYQSNKPGGKPFVEVGTKIKKGDIVGIVEAMKLMNEIEAEIEGEVVEALVSNEQIVEYGQPLFKVR